VPECQARGRNRLIGAWSLAVMYWITSTRSDQETASIAAVLGTVGPVILTVVGLRKLR
jgi:hypothetical protein